MTEDEYKIRKKDKIDELNINKVALEILGKIILATIITILLMIIGNIIMIFI
ncbi:hypothetical protein [uncultured Clostridium sp.]|uniref:hypothetical protein n=1 Tax=uncultured Clostridium sp. TaxID=59620 RepID=UPI0026F3B503|nr:hypothetical protein [uncultured Clostridium sp.]